jgi:hypothetical protein
MGLWQVQTTLNRGELDPKISGRIDLEQYYQGVATGRNVMCIPQGGITKRPGQEFAFEVPGAARLELFSFSVTQNYLLVFYDFKVDIYRDDILRESLPTSYSGDEIQEFDYIQSADTIIITHQDIPPLKIVRDSDTSWTISQALSGGSIPYFDFNDSLSPTPTDEIQQLTFTDATNGDRFKLSFNGFLTDEIVYDTSGAGSSTAADIEKELNRLPNILIDTVSVVATSVTVYTITFQGQSISGTWEIIKATPVYVKDATNWAVAGVQTQAGTSRQEQVWSSVRGYPRTCTFHEGRLFFGGSKNLPNTIWGSYVSDYFKFEADKGFDDEPISATLDTDQINSIEAIYSNRSLQIFTAGAEFYVPESPITPENLSVQRQTNLGSKRVRPVTIDGITLFLQRTGRALYQFLYVDSQQANSSSSISILAPHLIKDPIKMAVKRGSSTDDANYVYLTNSDGTITVFNTLTSEGVAGFTRWEGTGEILNAVTINNVLYLCVEREIDGQTVFYIEKENPDYNLDSVKFTSGSGLTTITGLDHLEGETVKVKADGAVRDDAIVASGQITIDPPADAIEVGLDYTPVITTMPLNNHGLEGGPNIAQKKRILRAGINIYNSNGVIVNGQRIADRTIGINQFDPPEPQTGIKRIFIPGWSLEAQLTITQDTPFPLTILNISNEVMI